MQRWTLRLVSRPVFSFVLATLVCAGAAGQQGGGVGWQMVNPRSPVMDGNLAPTRAPEDGPPEAAKPNAPGDGGPSISTRQNDLSLEGYISYSIAGDRRTVQMTAERVANNRSGGVSGTIRLSLWASQTAPVFGSTIQGYRLGYYQFSGTLQGGYYFGPVDRTVSFQSPPNGTYYITMAVDEYSSSNNPNQNDGFGYRDFRVFSNTVTFGPATPPPPPPNPTPPPPPPTSATIIDHAMTSSVDASTFLPNNRTTTFSGTASAAYSWVKFHPFVGTHTLQWKFFAPDGSLYFDSGVNSRTGMTGPAYYAYYHGINIAGTSAASKPGTWRAVFYLNGSPAVTESFTISSAGNCTESSTQLCLMNNRFSVQVAYDTGSGRRSMTAIKYTPNTGLFWFVDAGNIEVLLKVIDACSFSQKYWVYAGGTTDVEVIITVTDTRNNQTKTYVNPRGARFGTITDGDAFPTCP